MKKLIVAFLLAVCMCFGLADTAEATEKNAPAVFEITTEDSFQSALQKIRECRDAKTITAATLIFKNDFNFTYEPHGDAEYDIKFVGKNYFSGVEGVTITLTSDERGPYTIKNLGATFGSMRLSNSGFNSLNRGEAARFFTGAMVLDNIKLDVGNQDRPYYVEQGFPLKITEKFTAIDSTGKGKRINLIGGCVGKYRRLDGLGFDNGYVENKLPTSTHLEVYGGEYTEIYGGYNSDVNGDVFVKVALKNKRGTDNNRYNCHNIYGGSNNYGNLANKNQGIIYGNVHVIAGEEKTKSSDELVVTQIMGGSNWSTIGGKMDSKS